MARTLTAAAQTEAAKTTGASFRIILEIQFGGGTGTKYYSWEALSSPVTAEGRILQMTELEIGGEPRRVGGFSDITITLRDNDYSLKTLFDAEPGVQNKPAYLHLWFEGTLWADRVTLAGGILTSPMRWRMADASWTITLKGFEHLHDKQIGQLATTDIFPEISCRHCENKLIPIAFGRPVYRVPACVIDRPGVGMLGATLEPWDTEFTLNTDAGSGGFTTGSSIDVLLGYAGNYELVTGSFDDSSDTTFSITSRGAIYASGSTVEFVGVDGVWYVAIPTSALGSLASKAGYPLYIQQRDGTWVTTLITVWDVDVDRVLLCPLGDLDLDNGTEWKIGSAAGFVPIWPAGTAVEENGAWTWCVNFLPSESVDRVEARASLNVPGGDSKNVWLAYDASAYSVNLNNQNYNGAMGRDPTDPGLTTITSVHHPMRYGFNEETVWVTLKATATYDEGTSEHGGASSTAMTNAADIIQALLTDERLGGLDDATYIDSASFAAAKSAITTTMGFALLSEKKKLLDLCSELAFQAGCLLFWDQGVAHLVKLDNTLSGSEATITASNLVRDTLEIEEQSLTQWTTELSAKFKLSVPSAEVKIVRKSTEAEAHYEVRRDEIELWAYQFPSSAALITEFWLQYRLNLTRMVEVGVYLDVGLKLQPGDVVTLDVDDGNGNAVFASKLARVRKVRHTLGDASAGQMPLVLLTLDVQEFSYAIATATPSDDGCTGNGTEDPGIPISETKSYLRSDGHNGGIYVTVNPTSARRDGAQNIGTASVSDPTLVNMTTLPWVIPYTPQPDPTGEDTSQGSADETSIGCKDTLDGWGVEDYPGYQAGVKQALIKTDDDCLQWQKIGRC